MILYLRIVPSFWVAVEERTRPDLRTRPFIIGGLPQQRGLVREANLTAQHSGVRAGMTCAQALQYCPDGVFLLPDLPRYEVLWEEVCTALSTFTPLVQPLEMGHAVCDLSGCERRWNDVWEAGYEVVQSIAQYSITPWVGIASNRLVAELASTTVGPNGITIVEIGQERAFLADLPLTSLPDVDPRLALTFQVLGLKTIGQFAALPASAVRQRFGSAGEKLHLYARGIDGRPVVPPPGRAVVTACYDCEDGSIEETAAAIPRLADICAAELQQRYLAGRLISLSLTFASRAGHGGTDLQEVRREGRLPSSEPSSLTIAPPTTPPLSVPLGRGEGGEGVEFPVPYRIHSMLPQPSKSELAIPGSQPISHPSHPLSPASESARTGGEGLCTSQLSRTPLETSPVIAERAQRLLLRLWPRDLSEGLESIKLEISEFQGPIQLSFVELDRIDQTGALRGMDPVRLQALSLQEQVLTARYGDASFRHLTHVDPANILTERRFRWGVGLPPVRDSRSSRVKRRRRA